MTTPDIIIVCITCLAVVGMIVACLILLQEKNHSFLLRKEQNVSVIQLSEELKTKLKDFDDYKRRVDAIGMKTGMKL